MQEKRYSAHDAYSTSKLAMMLITAEQAQRLGSHGPTSNCLDPGTVNTTLLEKGKPKLLNPKPCNVSRHDSFRVLQTEHGFFSHMQCSEVPQQAADNESLAYKYVMSHLEAGS